MTYVMSDLHGQYQPYKKMLDIIGFSDSDDLYVLGDVVDRGPESAELLHDMSLRANVYPLLGNHDVTARYILRRLCQEITEDNYATGLDGELLHALAMWQFDGGQATLDSFRRQSPDERDALLDYLDEFEPYETVEVGGKRFVLVHGGIAYDKRTLPLDKQDVTELVLTRPDYSKRYYNNTYLVTGHTPTVNIDPSYSGKIWQANGHIALDCGAGHGLRLGCLRLEDFAEFYA